MKKLITFFLSLMGALSLAYPAPQGYVEPQTTEPPGKNRPWYLCERTSAKPGIAPKQMWVVRSERGEDIYAFPNAPFNNTYLWAMRTHNCNSPLPSYLPETDGPFKSPENTLLYSLEISSSMQNGQSKGNANILYVDGGMKETRDNFTCKSSDAFEDDFPTPPWSKSISGSGSGKGTKSQACGDAEAAAKKDMSTTSAKLETTCKDNGGSYSFSSTGGVCMYNKVSQEASYDAYGTASCN